MVHAVSMKQFIHVLLRFGNKQKVDTFDILLLVGAFVRNLLEVTGLAGCSPMVKIMCASILCKIWCIFYQRAKLRSVLEPKFSGTSRFQVRTAVEVGSNAKNMFLNLRVTLTLAVCLFFQY